MTPDELRAIQRAHAGGAAGVGAGVGKIAPEMRALLIKQAGESAEEQTASDIDAHNAKVERQERHAKAARALHEKLNPEEKHAHKGKGK